MHACKQNVASRFNPTVSYLIVNIVGPPSLVAAWLRPVCLPSPPRRPLAAPEPLSSDSPPAPSPSWLGPFAPAFPPRGLASALLPQPALRLLDPPLLRADHLLRLALAVALAVDVHLVAPLVHEPLTRLALYLHLVAAVHVCSSIPAHLCAPISVSVPIPVSTHPGPISTETRPWTRTHPRLRRAANPTQLHRRRRHRLLPLRIPARSPIHHAVRAALPELIDSAYSIDSGMQGAAGIEVLLNDRQQILARAAGAGVGARRRGVDPGVLEGTVGGHALLGVDGQAALDELAGRVADPAPVLERGEGVVGDENGLHFFEVRFAVEGRVAAEEKVGYYADGPDVAVGQLVGEEEEEGELRVEEEKDT